MVLIHLANFLLEILTRWPNNLIGAAKALEVLTAATGFATADALIVMQNLRKAGYVVTPVNLPAAALGEVMTWTGCEDPHLVFEGVNSMLNILGKSNGLMIRPPWRICGDWEPVR